MGCKRKDIPWTLKGLLFQLSAHSSNWYEFDVNMYFHAVKSTAHPPIIGALGRSTDYIVKQPNTEVINICLL